MNNKTCQILAAAALAFASMSASASLTPSYDVFGTLSEATFGGTGISNKAVAIDRFTGKNLLNQSNTITLGLSVTSRYANQPAVTNNGAGVFYAAAGVDRTSVSSFADQLAQWNIDYYVGGVDTRLFIGNSYTYKLLIDIDPSAGENFKSISVGANSQDSINIGYWGYELMNDYSFDPTKTGQYSVKLEALNGSTVVGQTSILVNVNKVPEPASLALAGLALAAAGFAGRRRNKA